MSFTKAIQPYVETEFSQAVRQDLQGNPAGAFAHLENARVLGQSSTKWHTIAHFRMFVWAVKRGDIKEMLAQLLRIVGAVTKTAFGLVPLGNTGGSNVSPFKPMSLSVEHANILYRVSAQK